MHGGWRAKKHSGINIEDPEKCNSVLLALCISGPHGELWKHGNTLINSHLNDLDWVQVLVLLEVHSCFHSMGRVESQCYKIHHYSILNEGFYSLYVQYAFF